MRHQAEVQKVWECVKRAVKEKFAKEDALHLEALNAIDVAIGWVLNDAECTEFMEASIRNLNADYPIECDGDKSLNRKKVDDGE